MPILLVNLPALAQTVIPSADSIVYVKQGATGNGSSWTNALGELADALVAAKTNLGSIKQIWVAKGTYKPLYSAEDTAFGRNRNRSNTFLLVKDVQVYGGFAGTETSLNSRNWKANITVLSGNIGVTTDYYDNCYSVVMGIDSLGSARLDGFTVTDGYNDVNTFSFTSVVNGRNITYAGGIVLWYSSPVIANCVITKNTGYSAGGIYTRWSSSRITNCIISKNSAQTGGAIRNIEGATTISNCIIDSNTAVFIGAGIDNSSIEDSLLSIINCVISNNITTATDHGSGITNGVGSIDIINCTFYNNIAGGTKRDIFTESAVLAIHIYNSITRGEIYSKTPTALEVRHSMISGISSDTSNINGDNYADTQVFINAPAGNFRLALGSPCMDAGSNARYGASLSTDKDLSGYLRLFSDSIDMGACEWQTLPQNITCPDSIYATYGDTINSPAVASSGLPINYISGDTTIARVFQDPANNNDWKIVLRKKGTVFITMQQPGDTFFKPAPDFTLKLIIRARPLTITANSKTKPYGGMDPLLTYRATNFAGWDDSSIITGALSRTTGENTGAYTINLNTLNAGNNYSITYNSNRLTITPAKLDITANAQSKTYGDADPALTYTATGLVNGDDESIITGALSRAPGENIGIYAITQHTLDAGDNYILSYTGDSLTITPAAMDITANAQSKTYGDADPALTYAVTGFVNGDDESIITGALSRAAGEYIGIYAIMQHTLNAGGNYIIHYKDDSLTITPATLDITANAQSKTYGDADPALTYTVTGLVNGDDESIITGALSRAPGENTGAYAITQHTLDAGSNYTLSFTGDSFTITPATLDITANAQSKTYGDVDPALTYTVTGLFNGDDESIMTGTLSRDTGESVGVYPIRQGNLSAGDNYAIQFTGADFTIRSTLGITQSEQHKTGIQVYPNPAHSGTAVTLHCEYTDAQLKGAVLQLAELASGKVWQSVTEVNQDMQLVVPNIAGTYTITLILNNGQKATARAIVQ